MSWEPPQNNGSSPFQSKEMQWKELFFEVLKCLLMKWKTIFEQNIFFFSFINFFKFFFMVEPLLSGIVLGLVPVTIAGLFVTAYLQYRRGDQATW